MKKCDIIRRYITANGIKKWSSSLTVPSEMIVDEDYLAHLKRELKERCVREYVESIDDSFKYRISRDRIRREFTISIEIDDMFDIKSKNEKLHRELTELVDKYIALRDIVNS